MMFWHQPLMAVASPVRRLDHAASKRPGTVFVYMLLLAIACPVPLASFADAEEDREEWRVAIDESPFDEPIHLTSEERRDAVDGDVYAIVQHPFESLAAELRSPAAWCEFIFLHLNVKACVYREGGDADAALRIYAGSRHYQPPEAAESFELRLRVVEFEDSHLTMELDSDSGPYGTRDYRMYLEAMPYEDDSSVVHLHYSLGYGGFTRFMIRMYFAFAGRHRVGFTVEDYDSAGEPVYIGGLRGMIERNVIRFYLALQVYLETLDVPQEERLDERLHRWFELTERYAHQLREISETEYIDQKRREHTQQTILQAEYDDPVGQTGEVLVRPEPAWRILQP